MEMVHAKYGPRALTGCSLVLYKLGDGTSKLSQFKRNNAFCDACAKVHLYPISNQLVHPYSRNIKYDTYMTDFFHICILYRLLYCDYKGKPHDLKLGANILGHMHQKIH